MRLTTYLLLLLFSVLPGCVLNNVHRYYPQTPPFEVRKIEGKVDWRRVEYNTYRRAQHRRDTETLRRRTR